MKAYAIPSLLTVRPRPHLARELRCGALAGLVAGLAMAVALMALFTAFLGKTPFYPLGAIAESAFGQGGLAVGARDVVAGVFVHELGPSLFWGIAFGLVVWLARPRRGASLLLFGLLLGAIAQVVDTMLLLPHLSSLLSGPLSSSTLHPHDAWTHNVPVAVSWIAHLVFGAALSLYPWRYDPLAGTFD